MVALGDDRRSFSYHKAILVIEKLPFKIESVEQVKHLPGIGKSMLDHVSKASFTVTCTTTLSLFVDNKRKYYTISSFSLLVWNSETESPGFSIPL